MSDTRCGYPRPAVIPECARPRWSASWSISRRLSQYTGDELGPDDDIIVPLTMRAIRRGPCVAPIERACE